jgi:hypothetical protein
MRVGCGRRWVRMPGVWRSVRAASTGIGAALADVHRTVQAPSRVGQRLRMIGEPWWAAHTAQQSMAWARYESLVNAALAWSHAALLCTYDARVVGLDVVAQIARTHPELVVNGGSRPSPSYLDPVWSLTPSATSPLCLSCRPRRCGSLPGPERLCWASRSFVQAVYSRGHSVGHLPSGRSTARGRGAWLARQWCDLVEVRSDSAGTIVRLHLTLP